MKTVAERARAAGADLSEIARRHRGKGASAAPAGPSKDDDDPDLSHDGLALDLGRHSWDANARYVALWGKWLFWSETHWRRDETLEHLTLTRSFLRSRAIGLQAWAERKAFSLEKAGQAPGAQKIRSWARDQARSLGSGATVAAVSNLARANPASATTHEFFDANRFLVGTPGGTVDLRTGTLRTARRSDMISRRLTCAPSEPGTRP